MIPPPLVLLPRRSGGADDGIKLGDGLGACCPAAGTKTVLEFCVAIVGIGAGVADALGVDGVAAV